MSTRRTTALGVAGLVAAALLSACGSNQATGPDHAAADVTFATEMAQHHQQALQMVALTRGRTLDPTLTALAAQIEREQQPEISRLDGWLSQWGEPVPPAASARGDMGNMQIASMPGMMTGAQMSSLANAPDARFARQWLRLMIQHHQGALIMAQDEMDDGQYADAVSLASSISSSQSAEVAQMQQMLAARP